MLSNKKNLATYNNNIMRLHIKNKLRWKRNPHFMLILIVETFNILFSAIIPKKKSKLSSQTTKPH